MRSGAIKKALSMLKPMCVDRMQTKRANRQKRLLAKTFQEFKKNLTSKAIGKKNGNELEEKLKQLRHHPIYKNWDLRSNRTFKKSDLVEPLKVFDFSAMGGETAWSFKTSGTSGPSIEVWYSSAFHFINFYQVHLRTAARAGICGLGQSDIAAVFLTDNPTYQPTYYPLIADRKKGVCILPLNGTSVRDLREAAQELSKLQPEILSTKPSILKVLVECGEIQPLLPQLKLVISSGAELTSALRKAAEKRLKCPVVSSYNTTELGYVASECPRRKFHVDSTLHFAEVKTARGAIRSEGSGTLLVSSLQNSLLPLIRYESGDDVVLRRDGCGCGQRGPYISKLKGRSVPVFRLSSGESILPSRWMRVFDELPAVVSDFSLIQKTRDRFELNLIARGRENVACRAHAAKKALAIFSRGLPNQVVVRVKWSRFEPSKKRMRFKTEVPS